MTTRNGSIAPIFISLIDSDDEEEGERKGGKVLNGGGGGARIKLGLTSMGNQNQTVGNSPGGGGRDIFEGMMVDVNRLSLSTLRSIVSSIIVKGGGGGNTSSSCLIRQLSASSSSPCGECELLSTKAKELEKENENLKQELVKENAKAVQLEGKLGQVEQNLKKLQEITNTLVGVNGNVKEATESPSQIQSHGDREERKEDEEGTRTRTSIPNSVVSIEKLKVEEDAETGTDAKTKETEVNLSNVKVEESSPTQATEPSSSSLSSTATATSKPPEATPVFNGNAPPPCLCPPQSLSAAPAPVSSSSSSFPTTMPMPITNGHLINYHQVDKSKPEGIFCSCGLQFPTKNNFYYHVKKMTCASFGNAKFSCTYCPKKFLVFGMLKKHLESKHRMAYKNGVVGCRYCGEVFPTRIMLLCHQRVEHKGGHHRLSSWYHHHSLVNGQESEGNGVSSSSNFTTFTPAPVPPPHQPPSQVEEDTRMDVGIERDDVITIDSDDDDDSEMFQAQNGTAPASVAAPPSPPTTSESPDLFPNQTVNIVELPSGNGNVGNQHGVVGGRRMIPPAFSLSGMPVRLVPSSFTNGRHNYDGAQAQAAPPPASTSTGFVRINKGIFSSANQYQNQQQVVPQLAIAHENNGEDAELDVNDCDGSQNAYYNSADGYTYIDYIIRA